MKKNYGVIFLGTVHLFGALWIFFGEPEGIRPFDGLVCLAIAALSYIGVSIPE